MPSVSCLRLVCFVTGEGTDQTASGATTVVNAGAATDGEVAVRAAVAYDETELASVDISQVFQINADDILGSGQFGIVYSGEDICGLLLTLSMTHLDCTHFVDDTPLRRIGDLL